MKFLIPKLKCIAAIAVASAVFGFSSERSEAASSATMEFTVESGVVTHINITAPFGFYPTSGGTHQNILLLIRDLYPGDVENGAANPTAASPGMVSVAGSGVSYSGPVGVKGEYFGAETDGDFALIFFLSQSMALTSEDFVEISGEFLVNPSSGLIAPTAGMYSSALYAGTESAVPYSNTIMVEVIVNSVPEPGSCLLGLLGMTSLIVRRRR